MEEEFIRNQERLKPQEEKNEVTIVFLLRLSNALTQDFIFVFRRKDLK